MSAFLGPIHYWLYRKIQFQEGLIGAIADLAEEKQWVSEADQVRENYVSTEDRPLEELIDTANIHGWLQERIHQSETRYAKLVTALLAGDASRLEALKACAYAYGKEHGAEADATAADAYQCFENTLLNGMPCDRVNVVTRQEDARYEWDQEQDLHGSYWEEAEGNPAHYYALRDALMAGMLADTGLTVESAENTHYAIVKKAA
jgi:hypothetical protein